MNRAQFGWVVVTLGVVVGCGGSNGSTTSTAPTADKACGDVAVARCKALETCSNIAFQVRYADQASCESREKANCLAALAAPSTGNSPTLVEKCAAALGGNLDCAAYLANSVPAECQSKSGKLANGAACAFAGQCQSAYCSVGPTTLCGTCAAPPAAGAACDSAFCGDGLVCSAISKTCGTAVAAGAACDPAPCPGGTLCTGAVGKRTCQPVTSAVGGGQPCGTINGSHVACTAGGVCKLASGQTTAICLAAAPDGAACDETNGPGCATPARCVGGTCQLPSADSCH